MHRNGKMRSEHRGSQRRPGNGRGANHPDSPGPPLPLMPTSLRCVLCLGARITSRGTMGAGARAKKRRRGTKVKMPKKNHSKFIKPVFTHPVVAEHWDNNQSARQNLDSMGLNLQPNKPSGDEAQPTKGAPPVEFIELSKIDNVDRNHRRRVMSEEDQRYAATLLEQYGHNYKRMEMDIETNWLQHTATKLKTMCTKFIQLDDLQRLVPVPAKVASA